MSDPTQSGFTAPEVGTARLSATEIDTLCQKATRGAGLSWGLAEEAGFAARWLGVRGFAGCEALLDVLDRRAETTQLEVTALLQGVPSATLLSPIELGAALSDFAGLLPEDLQAGPVIRPLLLLPFVHQLCRTTEKDQCLTWQGGAVTISPGGTVWGDLLQLEGTSLAEIAITLADVTSREALPAQASATPDAGTIARLNEYAMRTTVPATASSRADAGSAEGDND